MSSSTNTEGTSSDTISAITEERPQELEAPINNRSIMSKHIGPVLVVSNFFLIVYLTMMIIVATVIIEVRWPEVISVSQQQTWSFPIYDRCLEVLNIVWAALMILFLLFGIVSVVIDSPAERQLLLSWIHVIGLTVVSVVQLVMSILYFVTLKDANMTAFFTSIFGVMMAWGIIVAALRVFILKRDLSLLKVAMLELDSVKILSDS